MITLTEYIKQDSGYLIILGDVHLGDALFTKRAEEKLKGYINWVKETPNARVFLNGDIFNVATRASKTSPFEVNPKIINEQTKRPGYNEMMYAVELFSPIADQIIGATDGNHENRLIDFANYSLTNELCQRLATKDRKVIYCGTSCILFLKIGKAELNTRSNKVLRKKEDRSAQTYSGYIHHTTGGGSTIGGKMNRVDKLRQMVSGCDFYAGSHNHMEGSAKAKIFIVNHQKCNVSEVRQMLVDCGGFLDYGGYIERAQCAPTDIGAPRIRFDAYKHDIHVSL
jgi:hypothetical protein